MSRSPDQHVSATIAGYIRKQAQVSSIKVPDIIQSVVRKFYWIQEKLFVNGNNLLCDEAHKRVVYATPNEEDTQQRDACDMVFGNNVIDVRDTSVTTYQWSFKLPKSRNVKVGLYSDQATFTIFHGHHILELLWDLLDVDANGDVEVEEFIQGMRRLKVALTDTETESAFRIMDFDSSGFVDRQEFLMFLTHRYESSELNKLRQAISNALGCTMHMILDTEKKKLTYKFDDEDTEYISSDQVALDKGEFNLAISLNAEDTELDIQLVDFMVLQK